MVENSKTGAAFIIAGTLAGAMGLAGGFGAVGIGATGVTAAGASGITFSSIPTKPIGK